MTRSIALDVTPELAGFTGVARYSRELGAALERRGDCDVVRFAIGRGMPPPTLNGRHFRVPLRIVHPMWRLLGFPPAERLTGPVDVVHSVDLVAPPTGHPLVVTVHDVVTSELPHLHPARAVRMQERQRAELARAHAVLTVSQATAETVAALGVDRERIHIARNGLTPLPGPVDPPVPDRPFVLVVGTLEPRKGHELLIRALAKSSVRDLAMVFVGPTAGRANQLLGLASRLRVIERLFILGHVADAVLAGLYREAELLCLPSLAEGFGLPLLEAMSAGLPVVASDLPVVREVTAGCAVRFAVGDVQGLTQAIETVVSDAGLRARLRSCGPARAAGFTWDATAAATVSAYDSALAAAG